MKQSRFPDDFLWGAATSAHQVEGGNNNNWTIWEAEGHVKNGDLSADAADHWNRFEEDFDLLEELNLNSYRFSLEWSRIEPEQGKFDTEAVVHYRKMLASLRKRNITPIVTLHHFTDPLWLEDWTKSSTVEQWQHYVEYVVKQLGDLVSYWATINEPMNLVLLAYGGDVWPPQYKSIIKGYRAAKRFVAAHKQAYQSIHALYKENNWQDPRVGIPLSLPDFTPASKGLADRFVNDLARRWRNHYFLKRVAKHLDWLGVNYYHTFRTRWNSIKSFTYIDNSELDLPKSDMGWNIDPQGLRRVCEEVYRRYNIPIIITENGIADCQDKQRKWYIVKHLQALGEAIKEGIDVRGYLHWSLIDNFEWADGYSGCFGLVAVNFKTQQRTVRASAWTYADIAQRGGLSQEDLQL